MKTIHLHIEKIYSTSLNETEILEFSDKIYDLREDPDGYKKAAAHPIYGLRKGEEWNTLLENLREDYEGVFYGGSFDVVSLFIPYSASRVPEEEQASLEG